MKAPPIDVSEQDYTRWLALRLPLIAADLEIRRQKMATSPFAFLRATFYRWVELWPSICSSLDDAPRVLGVGDLHVENFGTWRDSEARLAWGVNDFDEAAVLPYTNDLVRLCASAVLALRNAHSRTSARRMCHAVLDGYRACLSNGGKPGVPGERHEWLQTLALQRMAHESEFWAALATLKTVHAPAHVRRLLARAMPTRGVQLRIAHRVGGLGSLGRQRFTAIGADHGGSLVREAKALTSSAWHWRSAGNVRRSAQYGVILRRAIRVRDPSLRVAGGWVVRRLAPDCRKIEFAELNRKRDLLKLLGMMGWETGNVHAPGRRRRIEILRDLKRRDGNWLEDATKRMVDATRSDWQAWRKARRRKS